MKLISLNTWGGRAGKEKLLEFFEEHKEIDIFCLQEIWNGGEHMLGKSAGGMKLAGAIPKLLPAIASVLPDHRVYFRPHFFDFYGLAVFVRNQLPVTEEGDLFVHHERGWVSPEELGNHARNIQWITIKTKRDLLTIINFHGLWNGGGKGDSDDRLLQSDNIITFLKTLTNPFILCGDFNLLPNTESLKKLEDFGLRNLIKECGITSTRTSFYTKENRFADYALTTKDINVKDFRILSDEISDHSPLYLEFE
jgi:exonuclease III